MTKSPSFSLLYPVGAAVTIPETDVPAKTSVFPGCGASDPLGSRGSNGLVVP